MKDVTKIALGIVLAAVLLFVGSAVIQGIYMSKETTSTCEARGHQYGTEAFWRCKDALKR